LLVSVFSNAQNLITEGFDSYAGNLQLILSTNRATTTVPSTGPTSLGDFSNFLLEINPSLVAANYLSTFTLYSYPIFRLTGEVACKIEFRYFVTSVGPSGNNSNIRYFL
jgi:hypothetical protein